MKSGVTLLRAADHRRMPWKNGGGETREIAAHPPGADTASFDWRISMARVEADGPFSVFPGVERILAILDGAALDLAIEGERPQRLTPRSPPYAFPADAPTVARLPNGPIVDLNVMVRRDRFSARVERLSGTFDLPACPHTVVILALGPASIEAGADLVALDRDDALLVARTAVRIDGAAGFFRLEIGAVAGAK